MKPERILETCLYAEDLEKAEAFYSRVLGLEAFARVEGRHVFFRCGPGVFLLFNPEATGGPEVPGDVPKHGATGPGHAAFAMGEDEVDLWRAKLIEEEVEIELEWTWPSGGRSLYFRDTAGNSLELATPRTWNLDS